MPARIDPCAKSAAHRFVKTIPVRAIGLRIIAVAMLSNRPAPALRWYF